jgi:hypothetical protein
MNQADRKRIIKKLDVMFSELIRRKAMIRCGGCERCSAAKSSHLDLQCAHMFSRRGMSVRFMEEDACGLCGGCHMFLDSHPIEKIEFFKKLLGEERFELLNDAAHKTSKPDYKLIELYLKQQLETLDSGA